MISPATNTAPLWLVMRDFGQIGREAIIDPNHTRQNIIDLIRSGEWDNILYVYELAEGHYYDVTEEFLTEAGIIPEQDPPYDPSRIGGWESERAYDGVES